VASRAGRTKERQVGGGATESRMRSSRPKGEIHAGRKGNHLHLLRCPPASSSSPWYMPSHPLPTALPEHFEGHEKQHIRQIFAAFRSNRARCRAATAYLGTLANGWVAAHVPHPTSTSLKCVIVQKAAFSDARRKSRWLNQLCSASPLRSPAWEKKRRSQTCKKAPHDTDEIRAMGSDKKSPPQTASDSEAGLTCDLRSCMLPTKRPSSLVAAGLLALAPFAGAFATGPALRPAGAFNPATAARRAASTSIAMGVFDGLSAKDTDGKEVKLFPYGPRPVSQPVAGANFGNQGPTGRPHAPPHDDNFPSSFQPTLCVFPSL
jgi:hypothetical protein